mgnify:CR=1 FL=1
MPRVGTPPKKGEGALVGVEHHLLGFARIDPDVDRPRGAQPDVGRLHPERLAADLDVLVTPVELERLARRKQQRHEGHAAAAPRRLGLRPPARRVASHRVIRPVVAILHEQVPDPEQRQAVPLRERLVLRQHPLKPLAHRPDLRKRLARALITERPLRRPDRLAHHLRDSFRSRAIALIGLPAACSRRIRTTVSTTNIPILTARLNPSGLA